MVGHFLLNKINMISGVSQFPQVLIGGPHSTIHATLLDIKLILDEVKIFSTLFTLPNFLKRLFRQVPIAKPFILKIGTAPVGIAARHDVGPKKWR